MMKACNVLLAAAVLAVAVSLARMFVFSWSNPDLTQMEVFQENVWHFGWAGAFSMAAVACFNFAEYRRHRFK